MESIKADEYISSHIYSAGDMAEEEQVILDLDAESAVEMAEKEMKEKAIEVFGKIIDDCHNCKDACLPQCGKDCLINKFKELLNK